jgi:hypothetical protein
MNSVLIANGTAWNSHYRPKSKVSLQFTYYKIYKYYKMKLFYTVKLPIFEILKNTMEMQLNVPVRKVLARSLCGCNPRQTFYKTSTR